MQNSEPQLGLPVSLVRISDPLAQQEILPEPPEQQEILQNPIEGTVTKGDLVLQQSNTMQFYNPLQTASNADVELLRDDSETDHVPEDCRIVVEKVCSDIKALRSVGLGLLLEQGKHTLCTKVAGLVEGFAAEKSGKIFPGDLLM